MGLTGYADPSRTQMTQPQLSEALDVACPICGVDAGAQCHDLVQGLLRPVGPHLYRAQVARKVTR
jgi:hypothetical protein